MSKSDIWMPLYVGEYLADTMRLTTLQHGAYFLLLMQYWKSGPLPNDEDELAAIAKMEVKVWKKISASIRRFFDVAEDGLLHQKRADFERAKAADISSKRRAAGAQRRDRKIASDDQEDGSEPSFDEQEDVQMHQQKDMQLQPQLDTHARGLLQLPTTNVVTKQEEPPILPPPVPVTPSPTARPLARRMARSHLPADWWPSMECQQYAIERGLNVQQTVENFRDYYIGEGKPMADWSRTWQRWCRNTRPSQGGKPKFSNGATQLRLEAEARGEFLAEIPW